MLSGEMDISVLIPSQNSVLTARTPFDSAGGSLAFCSFNVFAESVPAFLHNLLTVTIGNDVSGICSE